MRTIPANGLIIFPHDEASIESVLRQGCWTRRQQFGIAVPEETCKNLASNGGVFWNATLLNEAGSEFELAKYGQGSTGEVMNRTVVSWNMTGLHNVRNGLAAIAAAQHVGVEFNLARQALAQFKGVKRRMELRGEVGGIRVYDDFAHHPTAIASTLAGIAAEMAADSNQTRLIAVIEPRSNTMKLGLHQDQLAEACQAADMVLWQRPEQSKLDFNALVADSEAPAYVFTKVDEIVAFLEENCQVGDNIVIMSNGGFGGIHEKLLQALDPGPSGAHRF